MNDRLLVNRDEEHLRLLSLFYYIFGALHGFFSFFALIYVALGILFMGMPASEFNKGGDPQDNVSPAIMGGIFIGFGALFFVIILLFAIGYIFSGLWIKQRKHRWFSLMMAGFNCLNVPFGTILGVFTFIVLTRSTVKEIFNKPIASLGNARHDFYNNEAN